MTAVPPLSRAFALSVLTLLLGLLGCSSASETAVPGALPSAFPNHSSDEIRTHLTRSADSLERFSAQARVSVETPDRNRSFNADIRQRRADSLFMRFSLFGFEGGRMLLTPDSIFMYDSRNRTLRVGPVSDARQLLPAPVASGEVFANLLGLLAPNPGPDWTVTADSARYYLSNADDTQTWTIDPRRWRVVQYEHKSPDGDLIEARHYSDFKLVEGVALPHSVTFRHPKDDLVTTLNYRSIDLNPSGLSFDLGVPSNVPRRPIRGR